MFRRKTVVKVDPPTRAESAASGSSVGLERELPREEEVAAAQRLQSVTRGRSARRLRRSMTENLESQRSVAMELLASEIEYLHALTTIRESFEALLRAAPASSVPADAPAKLFSGIPALVALHRQLIGSLESIAGCTSSGRRLASELLAFTAQLSEHYTKYAQQWAASAEHTLKGLESNPRSADLVGSHGGGGGGDGRDGGGGGGGGVGGVGGSVGDEGGATDQQKHA